jgi:hypothetical protein
MSGQKDSKNKDGTQDSFNTKSASLKRMFKRYWGLTLKELKVLINDKAAMLIAYALPIVIIILLGTLGESFAKSAGVSGNEGFTGRGDVPNEKPILGFIDYDQTALSEEFLDLAKDYRDTGYCVLVISDNQTDLERLLGLNQINSIVIIPALFEYNLSIHFPTIIAVVFDTIDTTHLQNAQSVVAKMVDEFKYAKGFTGVFDAQYITENVPERGRTLFVASPMFFPMILFSLGTLTATQSIVSDIPKDRMVLTPTNKYEMLAAKTTALQIIMSGLIVVTIALSMAFGLVIRGDIISYFGLLFIIALSGVVWGLLVSALAEVPLNALQYFIFLLLFFMIALLFLNDPNILRWIPMRNGTNLLMNVTLRGEPIAWNLRYIYDTLIEVAILYVATQWLFNRKKNML